MADLSTLRADHVGSFLRPPELLEARKSHASAEDLHAMEDMHAMEDKHILRVLEKQKELGFKSYTDGELRRSNFMSDFTEAVEGFDLGDAVAAPVGRGRGEHGAEALR